jgi:hypothetical protein
VSAPIDIKTGAALNHQPRQPSAPTSIQAACSSDEQVKSFAPGVTLRESTHSDIYVGTADALVTAGLMKADQFPGQPGMRKVVVTIFADGTLPAGAPTVKHRRAMEAGAKRIQRASRTTFSVRVIIAQEDRVRRAESIERADQEYETRMRALPRPPPLVGASAQVRDVFRDKPRLTAVTRDFPPREITRGESPPKPLLTLVGDNVVPFGAVVAAKNKSNRSSGGLADIKRQLDATAWCLYEAHQNIRRALPSDQWGGLDILKFLAGCLEKESSKLSSIIEAGGNP